MRNLTIYVRSVLQLLAIAAVAWLVYTVRGIIIYIIIAALIALVSKPLTNLLARIKIKRFTFPRALAALITVLVVISFFSLITLLLVPQLVSEFAVLSTIDFSKAYENANRRSLASQVVAIWF
jgi:predicted PurR-regulated permease PerM